MPKDLIKALSSNKKASDFFNSLTQGYKKEGVAWIESAKKEETRNERIRKLVEMHSEGRRANDHYRK